MEYNLTKTIALTQGKVALVDDSDYEWLSKWKWCACKSRYTYYACRTVWITKSKSTTIKMHRLILNAPKGMDVDHRGHDGLNNQRHNIRICTRSENKQNSRSYKNRLSAFKGLCWVERNRRWKSQITQNKKTIFLGYFHKEIDAAKAYDVKAKELFGEFAFTNF